MLHTFLVDLWDTLLGMLVIKAIFLLIAGLIMALDGTLAAINKETNDAERERRPADYSHIQ
jgi:hypothetical protein